MDVSALVGCWIFTACQEPPQLLAVPPPLVLQPVAVPPLAQVTLYAPPSQRTAAAGPIDESSAIELTRARDLNFVISAFPILNTPKLLEQSCAIYPSPVMVKAHD